MKFKYTEEVEEYVEGEEDFDPKEKKRPVMSVKDLINESNGLNYYRKVNSGV